MRFTSIKYSIVMEEKLNVYYGSSVGTRKGDNQIEP